MKVLIADRYWVCRAGLMMLSKELDATAQVVEAGSLREARERLTGHQDIDLIVLDAALPDLTSLDAIRQLLGDASGASLVMFSAGADRGDILRAVELGAAGFIPKSSTRDEIVAALKQVLAGQVFLPRAVLESSSDSSRASGPFHQESTASHESIALLTDRQREVLSHLAQGMSNTKIAKRLGLSENTVRIHISAILRTLDLDNRTQAALLAAERLRQAQKL